MDSLETDIDLSRHTPVCIVIPTYNEADNIPQLVSRIDSLGISDLVLLLVDDNSPDGTADLADLIGKDFEVSVKVLRRSAKAGLGTAYIEGFHWALDRDFNAIIQMDADLSHPPEYITKMLKLLDVCQVVVASRYMNSGSVDKNWNWTRKLLSRVGNYGVRKIAGLKLSDATSGFKAYRKSTLALIDFELTKCKGFGFQCEIAYMCQVMGFKIFELPIVFPRRQFGNSKMSLGIIAEAIVKIIRIRVKFP